MTAFRVVAAGDSALVVEFDDRIDVTVNARTIAFADKLQQAGISGVRDVVPAYRSVTVYFDPLHTDGDRLFDHVERYASRPSADAQASRSPVRIPVCYGDDLGPDLADVAAFARMDRDGVVAAHTARTYRVFMLGFVPGFAYLGIVDERIAMPRRASPRLRVPAGSVAVAGGQTGIYPMDTPGGWQILGRTPAQPFDPRRDEPFLLKAGDAVQFYAIDRAEYESLLATRKEGTVLT